MVASCAFEDRRVDHFSDGEERLTNLIIGEQRLQKYIPAIRQLRLRCGQQDDLTTEPEYFVAANTLKDKRVAAVLISHKGELEACVLFFEYCKCGLGLGLFRGGDRAGESLVIGREEFRVHFVQLATQTLFRHRRVHGVRLTVSASLNECLNVMGPASNQRIFYAQGVARKLPLESTYQAMLAGMGSRTRRSLAGKRQQLENRAGAIFTPQLEPAQALAAMLSLQPRSLPNRITGFYHARHNLACRNGDFFCMGVSVPDGKWLSILSGWRREGVTYVDLQMNDVHYKRESLSAVMRAFMLEHEIAAKQTLVNFVGGTSLLLRRYCRPIEACTYAYLWRPCLRAWLFNEAMRRIQPEYFDKLIKPDPDDPRTTYPVDYGLSKLSDA